MPRHDSTLQGKMAGYRQWCFRGLLASFSAAAILCIVFCLLVVLKPSYQKSGLVTIYVPRIALRLVLH